MLKFTEEEACQIKKLTNDFVAKTLGNELPNNKCFTVCYALSLYLKSNKFKNKIKASMFEGIGHYWLKIEYDKEPIIDPTIKQFCSEKETTSPYFGLNKEIHNEIDYDMNSAWEIWRDELLNCSLKMDEKELIILLNINLNAAILINVNIENKNIVKLKPYKKYFDCIQEVIIKYYNTKKFEKLSLLDDFDKLLSKVKIDGHSK